MTQSFHKLGSDFFPFWNLSDHLSKSNYRQRQWLCHYSSPVIFQVRAGMEEGFCPDLFFDFFSCKNCETSLCLRWLSTKILVFWIPCIFYFFKSIVPASHLLPGQIQYQYFIPPLLLMSFQVSCLSLKMTCWTSFS